MGVFVFNHNGMATNTLSQWADPGQTPRAPLAVTIDL